MFQEALTCEQSELLLSDYEINNRKWLPQPSPAALWVALLME
jgi:hypothetical protein